MKQVIVVRSDLNMPPGKVAAQVAHASMTNAVVAVSGKELTAKGAEWFHHPTLIVCRVGTYEELMFVHSRALEAKIDIHLWQDAVDTETAGIIQTVTCLALGPDVEEKLDTVTGKLPLY